MGRSDKSKSCSAVRALWGLHAHKESQGELCTNQQHVNDESGETSEGKTEKIQNDLFSLIGNHLSWVLSRSVIHS